MALVTTSRAVSERLNQELNDALANPREIYGIASYGEKWPLLNRATGGIHERKLAVIVARPKVGKSTWVAQIVPDLAYQALLAGKVLRLVILESTTASYQRRMAAYLAGIPDPKRILQGFIVGQELKQYRDALSYIATLPIDYLSNDDDLNEQAAMVIGGTDISFDRIRKFVTQPDTFWWVVDHVGLVADLNGTADATRSMFTLANMFSTMAHRTVGGAVITHLTRASLTVGSAGLEAIGGSDQWSRNTDQAFILRRPFIEPGGDEAAKEAFRKENQGDIAQLRFVSRDEGQERIPLWFSNKTASFREIDDTETPATPTLSTGRRRQGA